MKISERNTYLLRLLQEGGKVIQIYSDDEQHFIKRGGASAVTLFDKMKDKFSKKIYCISQPVCEAMGLAMDKMITSELLETIQDNTSCSITMGAGSYCLYLDPVNPVLFGFYQEKLTLLVVGGDDPAKHISFFSEKYYKSVGGDSYKYDIIIPYAIKKCFGIVNFLKYAPIETKYLEAGQRIKDIDCKYVNESKSNITIVDSRWMTTLVKSDSFHVRGHFRLQPKKKDGEWTKELIWINDFQKSGYTAPARKLLHE